MEHRKRKGYRPGSIPHSDSAPELQRPPAKESGPSSSHLPVLNVVPPPATADLKESREPVIIVAPKSHTTTSKRRVWLMFSIGGLVGVILAGMAYRSPEITLPNIEFFQELAMNLNLEGLAEVLPSLDGLTDILPPGLLKEAKDIRDREKAAIGRDAFSVGLALKEEGLAADLPLVMIPGVISTGLESWGTGKQSRKYFRKRLWGSWNMLKAMVTDQPNWKNHIMLDKETGLDPPGSKDNVQNN